MKKIILLIALVCSSTLWAGTEHFMQDVSLGDTLVVGEIPKDIENLEVSLISDKDLDIQLYGEDGTAVIADKNGLLRGAGKDSVTHHGMTIEWSGYNGTNGKAGHEYIKVTGKTTEKLTMKVYGYQAGKAEVDYSWGIKENYIVVLKDYNTTTESVEARALRLLSQVSSSEKPGSIYTSIFLGFSANLTKKEKEALEKLREVKYIEKDGQVCTAEYVPVCGTDPLVDCQDEDNPTCGQKTYGNMCTLKVAEAKFLYKGECKVQGTCPTDYAPVCGISSDKQQQSFMNLTSLLKNKDNYQLLHDGHCSKQTNVFCTMDCPGAIGINAQCETVKGCNSCTLGTDIITYNNNFSVIDD